MGEFTGCCAWHAKMRVADKQRFDGQLRLLICTRNAQRTHGHSVRKQLGQLSRVSHACSMLQQNLVGHGQSEVAAQ